MIIDYKGVCNINIEDIHLDNNIHLKEIEIDRLYGTDNDNFNTEFCSFLSAIARSRSIEKLYIEDLHESHNGINPIEVIKALSPLFNANLRDVCFDFIITEREAELLASTLSNSTNKLLTKISLYVLQVSDETAAKIYTALADYKLIKLEIKGGDVGRKSYAAISNLLQTTFLKKLKLNDTDLDDESIERLANALIGNNTLECLSLEYLDVVTKDGMLLLAKALQNPHSALRELDLSGYYFQDDDTAQVMANALACIPGLKTSM